MNELGPVSAFLEAELRTWIRKHGVVLWLDSDAHYTGLADQLALLARQGQVPYAVHGFRGSHLALLLQLENLADGIDRSPLLVHLPGFNEETIKKTPLLELYASGKRYRKRLDTLVTEASAGRVKPEEIASFTAKQGLTLASADDWLAGMLEDQDDGGVSAQLRLMRVPSLLDDLLADGPIAKRLADPVALKKVWEQLTTWTGLAPEWQKLAFPGTQPHPQDVAFAAASWLLAVEYVHDLKRPPVDEKLLPALRLPSGVVDLCCEGARHLRERHPAFYQRTADETEGWLDVEISAARAEDLGRIDTFRFEEEKVLLGALSALEEENWPLALDWAETRLQGRSFWLAAEPPRQSAWHLVHAAAALGRAISLAGPALAASSLEAALERYVERGAVVDQAHRFLEQRRTALFFPQLPRFEDLRSRLAMLRACWRTWADDWSRDFCALCRDQGFLPALGFQQRTLFEEVVRPLTQEPGPTALFLVDALRFEMGQELASGLDGMPGTTVTLKARFAELPTVTEVGMNALAPVVDSGRLAATVVNGKFKGFSTGEFRVDDPGSRCQAMRGRVGGLNCPWLNLADVLNRDATSLKQGVARAKLVIVHSQEIDSAGENGVGPAVFDHVMQQLRAAWRLLREAGVRRFVFTSDHGFLLLDETVRNAQTHGRKVDPGRRHVISLIGAEHRNEARVALADLGYTGVEGFLMVPDSTAVFETGGRAPGFVHGGNTLQERVIPVLTMIHRSGAGADSLRYAIRARAREGVADMNCLVACVEVVAQEGLAFGGSQRIELAIRVVEDPAASVDLCQVRGKASLASGAIQAQAGEEFELFFKVSSRVGNRVRVELYHPGATVDVEPFGVEDRFVAFEGPATEMPRRQDRSWLEAFSDASTRQVFEHLQAHGAVTEPEVFAMLGSARAARRFAIEFEEMAAKAPFEIRIDSIAGVKRYVRTGSTP